MSALTQTWTECIFAHRADFTAFASSAAEGGIIQGLNEQPYFPAGFFDGVRGFGRTVVIEAQGILSTTATPTIIFQLRLGTTQGLTQLGGASLGITAAITCGNGITNKYWYLRFILQCNTPGMGTGNTTLSGAGYVMSPSGFASPFIYPLEPTTPDTATWTQTIDSALTQYLNLSVTWSASSALNTITTKSLQVYGVN